MSEFKFQTEVSKLLHLIIHSLYSHKEIFIRELISNASDAIDKLKFLTVTDEKFKDLSLTPRIDIKFDKNEEGSTLIISDNGIGMSEKDLIENLGTIAKSGTKDFIDKLSGDNEKDSNLIGQFGVGFYSSYMVADNIELVTKKAGQKTAHLWKSDGKNGFVISKTSRDEQGTTITLFLNDEGEEYANRWSIETVVKKYSDHIPFPIFLTYEDTKYDKDNEVKEEKVDQINAASAFWKRSKVGLKTKNYADFYKSFTNDNSDPMIYMHTHAEGSLEYTTLFFIPEKAPFNLNYPDYHAGVKLYVKRIFITDDDKELLPSYLRFVKGIIDSEDLPLNVSREILQKNKILSKIRSNSIKKILSELKTMLKKDNVKYLAFYNEYSRQIKEGLYQDFENKDTLLDLVLYYSSTQDNLTSFTDYLNRMQTDQKFIYYITGNKKDTLKNSPLLEMYKSNNIEVLLLDDEIDDIVITNVHKYKDFNLKSVNHSDAVDELTNDSSKKKENEYKSLLKKIKKSLGDQVKDVKISTRLTDSPVCLVADQNDPTSQMQEMMRSMGKEFNLDEIKPIFEINPNHSIIKKLSVIKKNKQFNSICQLLLDQSFLMEGRKINNVHEFVSRMNDTLEKTL